MTRIWLTANYLFEKYEQNGNQCHSTLGAKSVKNVRVFRGKVDIIIHSSMSFL